MHSSLSTVGYPETTEKEVGIILNLKKMKTKPYFLLVIFFAGLLGCTKIEDVQRIEIQEEASERLLFRSNLQDLEHVCDLKMTEKESVRTFLVHKNRKLWLLSLKSLLTPSGKL